MISILRARGVGLAAVVAAGLALLPAATAFAHVTVSSTDAAPGGFGKLVRVPSESVPSRQIWERDGRSASWVIGPIDGSRWTSPSGLVPGDLP